jgi:hypothetical protein
MTGILEDLLRPGSYPLPQPASVALRSTLLSHVFVTDREVWKVKRPVRAGTADLTTPEKRERACHEEVRLNRRLAPGVYLGVLPVRRDAAGCSFARGGTVVDYAVRMRRLPEDRSARALLAAGRLDFDHVERLARRMADFFRDAEKVPRAGTVESLRPNLETDLREAAHVAGALVHPAARDRVADFLRRSLRQGRRLLLARAAAGRVVEAHGDLRLDHVYFEERSGDPAVIDAADVRTRFGGLDPAADAAMLVADLEAAGRPDLGARFLARLAYGTDDYDLYRVIDLFTCWRAFARGKALGLGAEPGEPPAATRRREGEARRLFLVADRLTRPRDDPGAVVAVGGFMGTGKTTLAAALSRRMGSPVVVAEAVRLRTAAASGGEARESSRRLEDEVLHRAEPVLRSGRGVILDAAFRTRALRTRARRLAARHGRPFLLLEASCAPRLLRERLRRRSQGAATEAGDPGGIRERSWREYEPPDEVPADERLEADTTRPVEEIALEAEERLAAKAGR